MTARKAFAVLLLGACLALSSALTGCGLLGSDEPARPETPQMSIADAQKAVDEAKSRLVSEEKLEAARSAAAGPRAKAEELRVKWEKMRAQTLNANKNPDDRGEAPNTVAAKANYEAAAAEAQAKSREYTELTNQDRQAKQDLQAAQNALAAAKARPQSNVNQGESTPQPSAGDAGALAGGASLLPALLALACLGLLGFLLWRVRGLGRDMHTLRKLILDSHEKQAEKLRTMSASVSVLNEGPNSLASLMGEVARIKDWVYTDRQDRLRESKQAAAREAHNLAHSGLAQHEAAPASDEAVDFPISAESFLSRISGKPQMPIMLDPLKGLLVKDQEGLGLLMLVRDVSVYGGQLCMVPGMTRLQTEQDFHYNYERFYQCSRPAAGEVWINKPALVDRVDGGWKLLEKGQLEVRN